MNELGDKAQKPSISIGQQLSAADLNEFNNLRTKLALVIAQQLKVSNFQRDVRVLAETYRESNGRAAGERVGWPTC
jgi:hypothetical protein